MPAGAEFLHRQGPWRASAGLADLAAAGGAAGAGLWRPADRALRLGHGRPGQGIWDGLQAAPGAGLHGDRGSLMATTLGKLFLASVTSLEAPAGLLAFGDISHVFTPTELPLWEFVTGFMKEFGKLPE